MNPEDSKGPSRNRRLFRVVFLMASLPILFIVLLVGVKYETLVIQYELYRFYKTEVEDDRYTIATELSHRGPEARRAMANAYIKGDDENRTAWLGVLGGYGYSKGTSQSFNYEFIPTFGQDWHHAVPILISDLKAAQARLTQIERKDPKYQLGNARDQLEVRIRTLQYMLGVIQSDVPETQ